MRVIEAFDIVEDLGSRLAVGGEIASVDELQFEGTPETFHDGVVVAVAFTTHGRN